MRNFSIIATLLVIWTMLFPQTILASEDINTKTKIEFKTKISENVEKVPYNYEGYEPIKNELVQVEKTDREKRLDMWKTKQADRWNNLPKGKFTINASAYTAAADECGKSDGITASGLKVQEKRTLACPPEYPFGAKLEIEGYGVYTCEDRGGAIKGNKFDIYVETKAEAFAFGRRNLTAQFVQ
ncbi:MAG: 3D domain-containing protein [Candidatus Moranbacteria bacterium]|nr:3D domain-containing protein [Candidatus Moranbacteria bacterium]